MQAQKFLRKDYVELGNKGNQSPKNQVGSKQEKPEGKSTEDNIVANLMLRQSTSQKLNQEQQQLVLKNYKLKQNI